MSVTKCKEYIDIVLERSRNKKTVTRCKKYIDIVLGRGRNNGDNGKLVKSLEGHWEQLQEKLKNKQVREEYYNALAASIPKDVEYLPA